MTTKRPIGAGSVLIDGEKYLTETFDFEGERFTVRELSTDEADDIGEAATGPAPEYKFNGRLNTRMLLSAALVEPEITAERIGKYGGRKYLTILRAFNRLNALPEVNPTAPAGSAEPTSPDSGEPTPQS